MNQTVFKRRVYVTGLAFAVLSSIYIIRLMTLHFSGKVMVSDDKKTEAHRGYIKDRNGYILALSIEKNSLFANPEEIKNPEETARFLSPLLRLPIETIKQKFVKKKRFVWVKRKLEDPVAAEIRKSGIKGLYYKREYNRTYPHGELAANIIGFVGMDNSGLAGIEYSFNDALSLGRYGTGPSADDGYGYSIILTIDRFIQHAAEREIKDAVIRYGAKQGAVLAVEVKTGRVLALAKYPTFNPNSYYNYQSFPLRNFSVIDSYEPGSTFKIISLVSMLERDPKIAGNYYTCRGYIDIADVRINCTGVHGRVNMNDIIRHSCNVGVIEAMKSLSKKNFHDALVRFGFGRKTGEELPGETEGIVRELDKWSGLSKYSISIGQEVSVTSLQLAAAFCAIANGGIYVSPTVIESILDHDGNEIRRFKPAVRGRVAARSACEMALKMMAGVVASGTGQKAGSRYYCISGKTGTSQKFVRAKGYTDRVLSSFIGLAPCAEPEVCILVIIDDPADKLSGGLIATPVFAGIIDRVLAQQGVKKQHIPATDPAVKIGRRPAFDGTRMPDFSGMRLPAALELLIDIRKRTSAYYTIQGSGRVYGQSPAPGSGLGTGGEIILYLKE
jgi:cell division protein FtsI (penicillin-binding protein 3)